MQLASRRKPASGSPRIRAVITEYHSKTFSAFTPAEGWVPPVNCYQFADRIEVCVDLSGVAPSCIEVHVEPGRLTVRGHRETPEPRHDVSETMCIRTMEIDHGPFCRTLALPEHVDLKRVNSTYRDGLLWVRMPLRPPA